MRISSKPLTLEQVLENKKISNAKYYKNNKEKCNKLSVEWGRTVKGKDYHKKYSKKQVDIEPEIFNNVLNQCLLKYSQSDIARKLRVSRQIVSSWKIKNLKFPKKIMFEKLKQLL